MTPVIKVMMRPTIIAYRSVFFVISPRHSFSQEHLNISINRIYTIGKKPLMRVEMEILYIFFVYVPEKHSHSEI